MRTPIRTAAAALALAAFAGTASAQTVITSEPAETVVTRPSLALTPAQRTTVYRTIVPRGGNRAPIIKEKIVTETIGRAPAVTTERVVRPPARVQYVVGDRVPAEVELASVPESVAVEVPAVSGYKYMTVNGRLLLVDPVTSMVVAEVED